MFINTTFLNKTILNATFSNITFFNSNNTNSTKNSDLESISLVMEIYMYVFFSLLLIAIIYSWCRDEHRKYQKNKINKLLNNSTLTFQNKI